jgi:glycosyltransferase involved in cell wall biosynthesis
MKSWNMLTFLSHHYHVGLACPLKYGSDKLAEFQRRTELRHFLHDTVEIPRNGKSLLQSYLHTMPLNVYRSRSPALKREIAAIADQYDILLIDHYEASQYIPANYRGQIVLHTHNATYLMWERFAKSDANVAFRLATYLEAQRVKRYELAATKRSQLIFASPNDIDSLVEIGVERQKCRVTYHLGDDSQLDLPALKFEQTEKALLYIGTLNWEANVDGLMWFLESVWPTLKQKHPDLHFYVIGGNVDARLLEKGKTLDDIEFLGFVDELEPYFLRARLFMAPLRFGSGIKVKVLNAMSRGMPTVTTSVGNEGLLAKHMQHLAITDDAESMIDATDKLLTDKAQWEMLEKNSRTLVREHYTWKQVLGHMVEEIEKAF